MVSACIIFFRWFKTLTVPFIISTYGNCESTFGLKQRVYYFSLFPVIKFEYKKIKSEQPCQLGAHERLRKLLSCQTRLFSGAYFEINTMNSRAINSNRHMFMLSVYRNSKIKT